MFEYNGTQYTLDQVISQAEELGLSLEEYLQKNPDVKRIEKPLNEGMTPDFQDPTTPGAVVEGTAAPDMGFSSEEASLDFLEQEEILKRNRRDLAIERELIERRKVTDARAETSIGKMINSIDNMILRVRGFDDRLVLASSAFYRKIFGDEAIDNFVENPNIDDFWKIGLSDADVEAAVTEINRLEGLQGKTGEITTGFQEGNPAEILAGVVNAITSFGSSVITSAPTLGAGLITDFFADSFKRMNEEKAEMLGVDPIDLMNSEDAEFYKPLVLGTAAGALEKFGISKVGRAIGLIKGGGSKIANRFIAGGNEAGTEYFQGMLEAAESPLLTGDSVAEAVFDFAFSKEGLESMLQGFVGGAGVTTGATASPKEIAAAGVVTAATVAPEATGLLMGSLTPMSVRNAASELRSPQDIKNIDKLNQEIADLKEAKLNTKDVDIKNSIDAAIALKRNEIIEIASNGNKQINNVAESDLKEINSIKEIAQQFNLKAKDLNNKLRVEKSIDLKEYKIAMEALKTEFQANKKKLDAKLSDVSVKNQNISTENAKLIEIVKNSNNEAAIEKAKTDLYKNNAGFINKLINSTFNPNLDTDLTKQDFSQSVNLEFGKLINSYKIKENVPFGAYVQQNLPKRIAGIFDASLETTKEGEFVAKVDVAEQTNLIDESDLNLEAATPETSNAIFNKTGLAEDAVDKGSKEILKSKLPGLNEKVPRDKNPFLTAVEKASEGKFFESIYQKLGGNLNKNNFAAWEQTLEQDIDDFLALVEESGNKDYNRIKNKYLKGIYKGKKVGRAKAAQGGTAAGEGRYEYQTPTRQEAIDYFTKGGMTTLIERKKTYTKVLAHAVGKKGIAKVIKDPQVQKEFGDIQQILGKEVPKNIQARVIASLDRVIKVLETPIRPKGTLTADFGVFVADAAREIALAIAKGIRAALKKGISFAKAKKQVVQEASEDLNLDSNLQKQFVREVSAGITIEDVLTNRFEKTIEKVYAKVTTKRFEGAMAIQIKNLKEKLNSLKTDRAKQNLLKRFFGNISQTFQKPVENKLWKGSGARAAYNYYEKQLGVKLKDLGFTLKKVKGGESIAFENEVIFAPAGRPSTHKGSGSKDKDGNPNFYDYKFYENIVDDMDSRSEDSKAYLLSEISSLLDKDGKQAVVDFISIQNFYSDSPLRLVGKLNKYEEGKGALVYEHTPPIKSLQQSIYDILNSTDSKRQILNKVKKVLESSKVDLILKTSETKLNNLGRKTSGKGDARYKGVIKPENLIEFKRSKEKAAEIYAERNLNEDLNKIIEDKTGLPFQAKYSQAVAKKRGRRKGMMNFFIPHGAEDFQGLMYALLPKGEKGNAAMEWMKQNLFHPYAVAMENINRERMQMMNDFKALKKNLSNVPKKLKQPILKGDFTNEDAVRMWVWNSMGVTAENLKISKTVYNQLIDVVENNPDFLQFAEQLKIINKAEGYPKPDKYWNAGNITTDLISNLNTTKRKKHLELWKNNVDVIFDEDMYNKLEGEFGKSYVVALKNILTRMESGRNKTGGGGDAETNAWLDWINNSVGTIMFLNVRSAVLQTISTVNYMNWSDNNPLQAAKAFANAPQYWKDFKMIFNSDYLVERRGGLKINIAENEIADMANKGGVRGAISYLLNKGFVLTRMADSFAIANGGAAFYRNRVNSYLKQGLSQKEAEQKAFANFRELTEEAQQSSRPDRISKQQASGFGRIILAFGNTPMQYTRLMKRGVQDLVNKRGDWKTNMSKVLYYGIIQNFIFNALQKALFALGFGEEEEEEKKEEKYISVVEGMADSVIRGTGIYGAAVMTAKNIAVDVARRSKRPRPKFQDSAWKLLDISPPISSKMDKIRSVLFSLDYQLDEMKEKGLSLENPAVMAGSQLISATLNIPLDRVVRIMDNYRAALAEDTETWQRVALLLGWSTWELGIEGKKEEKKKEKLTPLEQARKRLENARKKIRQNQ